MSKWDDFDGGKKVVRDLDRQIAEWRAYQRRQTLHYIAIVAVILALVFLFANYDVRLPR